MFSLATKHKKTRRRVLFPVQLKKEVSFTSACSGALLRKLGFVCVSVCTDCECKSRICCLAQCRESMYDDSESDQFLLLRLFLLFPQLSCSLIITVKQPEVIAQNTKRKSGALVVLTDCETRG